MHLRHTDYDSRSISRPVLFHTMAMTKFRTTSAPFFISLLTNKKPRCCSVLFILRNEENAVCFLPVACSDACLCASHVSQYETHVIHVSSDWARIKKKTLTVFTARHYLLRAPSSSDKL